MICSAARFVTDTNLDIAKEAREQYKQIFAYHYAEALRLNHIISTIDIRKGFTYQLYFLLTVKDSPYAYLLTMSGYPDWSDNRDVFYDTVNGFSLAIPLDRQYRFDVRFYGMDDGKK